MCFVEGSGNPSAFDNNSGSYAQFWLEELVIDMERQRKGSLGNKLWDSRTDLRELTEDKGYFRKGSLRRLII